MFESALETHFFHILSRPKLHLKHDDVKEGWSQTCEKGTKACLKPDASHHHHVASFGRQGDWQLLAAAPSPLQLGLCLWQPLGHLVQPLPDHAVPVPHQCWGLQLHHGCEIPLQICLQGSRPCFGSGATGSMGACTPMFTAWLFICLMNIPLTFLRGPWLGKPWCATTPPLWLGGVTSTERPNLNMRLQPLWLTIAMTLHRHCLLRWPHCTLIIPKSLCGANLKRCGTSGKRQRGGWVQAETIMSHWELWGTCTLCNLQRASVIICEFCLPTL